MHIPTLQPVHVALHCLSALRHSDMELSLLRMNLFLSPDSKAV